MCLRFIEGSFGSDMTGDDSSAMPAIKTAPPLGFQQGRLSSFGCQLLAPTIAKMSDRSVIERIMVWRSVRCRYLCCTVVPNGSVLTCYLFFMNKESKTFRNDGICRTRNFPHVALHRVSLKTSCMRVSKSKANRWNVLVARRTRTCSLVVSSTPYSVRT